MNWTFIARGDIKLCSDICVKCTTVPVMCEGGCMWMICFDREDSNFANAVASIDSHMVEVSHIQRSVMDEWNKPKLASRIAFMFVSLGVGALL